MGHVLIVLFLFLHFILISKSYCPPNDYNGVELAPCNDNNEQHSPIVTTQSGQIRGKLLQLASEINGKNNKNKASVYEFGAIPYAEAPIGDRRFRRPKPVKPWQNVLDATRPPNMCPQLGEFDELKDYFSTDVSGSEDCLYLNIWVPKDALDSVANNLPGRKLLSTYVFIHGGGFQGGAIEFYNGTIFAGLNDIIVVVIQYRLGSLGFAYLGTEETPGNMGLWDQLEALKWINENIASFGGNKSEITIGGQSAGAASVTFHILSPYSRDYFQRAIVESGAAVSPWAAHTPEQATRVTNMVVKEICNQTGVKAPPTDKARCLKAARFSAFPLADRVPATSGFGIPVTPFIDEDFIPKNPQEMLRTGDFYHVPLLIGVNKDEGSQMLILSEIASEILPTPGSSKTKKEIDPNLNMTHYKELLDDVYRVFISGLQPYDPISAQAIALQYWPPKFSGEPKGAEIVDALSSMVADNSLLCPTYAWAQKAATYSNIYAYYFSHRRLGSTDPEWMGVPHSAELPFVFGEPLGPKAKVDNFNADDASLSLVMMSYWANFVKYGNPNGPDDGPQRKNTEVKLKNWPSLNGDSSCPRRFFEINLEKSVKQSGGTVHCGIKMRECKFWQEFYPQLVSSCRKQLPEKPEKPEQT